MAAETRQRAARPGSLLRPFQVCRSRSLEEIRAVMRERFGFGFEPLDAEEEQTDAAISCLDLPGLSMHYAHYGAEVEVTTPARRETYMEIGRAHV